MRSCECRSSGKFAPGLGGVRLSRRWVGWRAGWCPGAGVRQPLSPIGVAGLAVAGWRPGPAPGRDGSSQPLWAACGGHTPLLDASPNGGSRAVSAGMQGARRLELNPTIRGARAGHLGSALAPCRRNVVSGIGGPCYVAGQGAPREHLLRRGVVGAGRVSRRAIGVVH